MDTARVFTLTRNSEGSNCFQASGFALRVACFETFWFPLKQLLIGADTRRVFIFKEARKPLYFAKTNSHRWPKPAIWGPHFVKQLEFRSGHNYSGGGIFRKYIIFRKIIILPKYPEFSPEIWKFIICQNTRNPSFREIHQNWFFRSLLKKKKKIKIKSTANIVCFLRRSFLNSSRFEACRGWN